MSVTSVARVPELQPAGTAVTGAPRRSLASRIATKLGGTAMYVVVLVVAAFWLLPTLSLFIESLRDPAENAATGWWTVFAKPGELTIKNYQSLLANSQVTGSLWNTVLITVPATLLVVLLGALAAYALAWIEFPGRDWLFILVVALIVVPVQVAIIPDAKIFRTLNIYGNIPAVVAFHVAFGLPFAIFLLRNFFIGIPRDLLEAARMDGGTELTIFRRVVLPIGWPAIASLAIYQFMWVWNDLLVALVFAVPPHEPITYALAEQMRTFSTNIDVIGPGAFLSMVVPLGVFFALQRYFVQGVLAGSVK
ncbi:MAG: sugar ABC transporter permease [Actinobacteria bacterium 13_2_20CM_2_71_6]|nr:MAG: sugar ABC transporter permease [Actinobacteria bacterium 13_2_20CM_2_71_6]